MAKNGGFLSQLLGSDDENAATSASASRPFDEMANVPTTPFSYDPDANAQISGGGVMGGAFPSSGQSSSSSSSGSAPYSQPSFGGSQNPYAQGFGSGYGTQNPYGQGAGSGFGSGQGIGNQQPAAPYAGYDYAPSSASPGGSGIASVVLGILAFSFPILGIFFGWAGIGSANRVLAANPHAGAARVGKVICWIAVVLWVLILLFGILGFALLAVV